MDCEAVGNIIGTKTIINEFVAYRLLGEYKRAGEISVTFEFADPFLFPNIISPNSFFLQLRSSAIATYAICGFANPSSMGCVCYGEKQVERIL